MATTLMEKGYPPPGPSEARAPLFLGCMIIWHHGIYEKLIEE